MKKNTSLLFVFTFCFYSATTPMELSKASEMPKEDLNNVRYHQDEDEYFFSELTPVTSASIAVVAFLERADLGVDEKIDLMLQKGCSLVWKGCVTITQWFMQNGEK